MQDLPYEPLRVFISSKQVEFTVERAALADVIRKLPLLAPILAEEWSPQSRLRDRYLGDVSRSPIYVGLFGRIYSEPTELEYDTAREHPHRELLIYIKGDVEPEPPLATLLTRMKGEHVVSVFRDLASLVSQFERHLWDAVSRMIQAYMQLSVPTPVPRAATASSPQLRKWQRERQEWEGLGLPGEERPEHSREWLERLQEMVAAR